MAAWPVRAWGPTNTTSRLTEPTTRTDARGHASATRKRTPASPGAKREPATDRIRHHAVAVTALACALALPGWPARADAGADPASAASAPAAPRIPLEDLLKSAEAGNGTAQFYLALQWYTKAEFNLALLYWRGDAALQDPALAVKWARRAADHGQVLAQNLMGLFLMQGKLVPLDEKAAFAWFRRAAAKDSALAQINLANAYYEGRGVAVDRLAACDWIRRADVARHSPGSPDAASPEQRRPADELFVRSKARDCAGR